MDAEDDRFTIGVEEVFLLIDPQTSQLASEAGAVIPDARQSAGERVGSELRLSQVETDTGVCRTLDEVRTQIVQLRRDVAEAALRANRVIAGTGRTLSPIGGEAR